MIITILLTVIATIAAHFSVGPNLDRVVFFDVGQGDSALIQLDGKSVLVDGGGGDFVVFKVSKYLRHNVHRIDLVILTHPHQDHMEGLLDILERYEVGEVWLNPVCYKSELYDSLLAKDVKFKSVISGDTYEFANYILKVLSPFSNQSSYCNGSTGIIKNFDSNVNNDSIVLELTGNDKRVLFMGDAEVEIERALISKGSFEDVDILKAGHHCSNTSSSSEFMGVVKPELVICSLGEGNKYGHPGLDTIELFDKLGIKYLVTAEVGDIEISMIE